MKRFSIPTSALILSLAAFAIFAMLTAGCDDKSSGGSPDNSSPPAPKATASSSASTGATATTTTKSASKMDHKGDLTPELASEIINEGYKGPEIRLVDFTADGFKKAQDDGLIEPDPAKAGAFRFTDKTWKTVGPANQENKVEIQRCSLKTPVGAHVTEIKSIAVDPAGDGTVVDYVLAYDDPAELQGLAGYIYPGQKSIATFLKDADGWRWDRR